MENKKNEQVLKEIVKYGIKYHWIPSLKQISIALVSSIVMGGLVGMGLSNIIINFDKLSVDYFFCDHLDYIILTLIFSFLSLFYILMMLFIDKKNHGQRSPKYINSLKTIVDSNELTIDNIPILIESIPNYVEKYRKQRDTILTKLAAFYKLAIIPMVVALYKFLDKNSALYFLMISLSILVIFSIEIAYFFWKDFDVMTSMFIKNNYIFTKAKYELEYIRDNNSLLKSKKNTTST